MSNFTPLVTKKFSFDGDTVTIRFARMKRKHFLRLLPLFLKFRDLRSEEGAEQGDELDEKERTARAQRHIDLVDQLMERVGDDMAEYIRSVEGLTDAEGNPVDKTAMLEDSYFTELQVEVLLAIVDASMGPMGKKLSS